MRLPACQALAQKSLFQICYDVLCILEADCETYEAVGDLRMQAYFARYATVGRAGGMGDQGAYIAEADRAGAQADVGQQLHTGLQSPF